MAKPQKLYQFNLHKDARRCENQLAHYLQKTELKTFFFEQILYFHFSKMLLFNLCLVEIVFFIRYASNAEWYWILLQTHSYCICFSLLSQVQLKTL